jgi:glycosyltransferase involved in cell wall biosynthesis
MRVVLFPSSVGLVGVSTHIYNLAKLLKDNGMLDVVICAEKGWLSEKLADEGIPCAIVKMSYRPSKFIPSNLALFRFLKSRPSADVVHLHGRFPLFVSIFSLIMCSNLRFVATIHQFIDTGLHGKFSWKLRLETFLLRHVKRICCVSVELQNEVVNRMGKKKYQMVDIIPNWIQPLWHNNDDSMNRKSFIDHNRSDIHKICAIGRLSHEKGFDILIKAIAILKKQGVNVICHIFGDGPDKPILLNIANSIDIFEHISFKGTFSNVRSLLPNYDVIVIPSRSESFGITALEAYDASIPVVASNIPGLRSIVLDNYTGILFKSGDSESLSKAIKKVLELGVDVNSLILNGEKFVEEYLPSAKLLKKYKQFYKKQ